MPADAAAAPPAEAPGLLAGEYVLRESPFTVRRRVRWSECDPAGVVYAGNYPGFLSSAIEWFRRHLGVGGYDHLGPARTYQTPAKALGLVYMSSLWPDDIFDIVLFVGEVRTRTSEVLAEAKRADNGQPVFAGRLTSIYVSAEDRKQTVPVPDDIRQILATYRDSHPVPEPLSRALAR